MRICRYADKNGLRIEDPIHDQAFYFTRSMRELLSRRKVYSYQIKQNPGDAIFIPAGCPHQVCNIQPAIKIAMDFISPERIQYCVQLAKEFRRLSKTHARRYDILQAENILFFSFWRLVMNESNEHSNDTN